MSVRPRVLAVVGPTACGKSALGIALAERLGGEIVNCDSTAVYRGFDIGTDKVPAAERHGVPHHLIDVADPIEGYSAARYAHEASVAIRRILARGPTPILVGGTGLYYRALTRGLFPGPGADAALRARLDRVAARRGTARLHAMLARVDPASADRIQPRDRKRVVRALEVYRTTGRTLTEHFGATVSPLADCEVVTVALRLAPALTPNASPAASTSSSRAESSPKSKDSWRGGSPPTRGRSGASCTVRSWRCCAACATKSDAGADRAGEPSVRAAADGLVSEGARPAMARRSRRAGRRARAGAWAGGVMAGSRVVLSAFGWACGHRRSRQ